MCEVFTEAIEDFEVPEGLELEPSGDIVSEVSSVASAQLSFFFLAFLWLFCYRKCGN